MGTVHTGSEKRVKVPLGVKRMYFWPDQKGILNTTFYQI